MRCFSTALSAASQQNTAARAGPRTRLRLRWGHARTRPSEGTSGIFVSRLWQKIGKKKTYPDSSMNWNNKPIRSPQSSRARHSFFPFLFFFLLLFLPFFDIFLCTMSVPPRWLLASACTRGACLICPPKPPPPETEIYPQRYSPWCYCVLSFIKKSCA